MMTSNSHEAFILSLTLPTVLHTTVVLPIGNSDPDFGSHVDSSRFPVLSVVFGSSHIIIAVEWLVLVDSI